MDNLEENEAGSKDIKRKVDPESKCYFLRSAKTKQIKVTSFQLPEKIEKEKNSDIDQDSTALQETKNVENSEKNAEDEKCKKMKILKNQNNNDLNEFKLFAKEDCQLKADIFPEYRTLMKNRGLKKRKQKLSDASEKKPVVSKCLESENGKEVLKKPKIKIDKKESTFESKTGVFSEDHKLMKNRGLKKNKQKLSDRSEKKLVVSKSLESENDKEDLKEPKIKTEKKESTFESKTDVFPEDRTLMKNRGLKKSKRKLNDASGKKPVVSKSLESENGKENLKKPEIKTEKKESTFESKTDVFPDRTLIQNSGFKKSKRKLNDASETETVVSENLETKNGKRDLKLSKFKTERKKRNRTEIKQKQAKTDDSFNEDFKEASSKECNKTVESAPEIKTYSRDAIEKVVTLDVKDEKTDKNGILSKEKVNEVHNTDTEYIPFSNYFDITIPVMGKATFQNSDDKPCTKRYDLAVERNKRRFLYAKKTGCDDEILRLIKSEANLSENDKKKKAMEKKDEDIRMACYITELSLNIFKELSRDNIREEKITCELEKFFFSGVTPTCLLYVPGMVKIISFIRSFKTFSTALRITANECYDKCHAMFPVPDGYNFETVYTSEMRKFLPDEFDKMEDMPFYYGGIDDLFESSDFDDSDADSFNSEKQ